MRGYGRCPRCGSGGLEFLSTHIHCWECNYFPDDRGPDVRQWLDLEFRNSRPSAAHTFDNARGMFGDHGFDPAEEER